MSYTIYLEGQPAPACPTCGHRPDSDEDPDCPNPTYNLTAIFDLALTGECLPNPDVPEVAVVLLRKPTDRPRGLRLLDGKTGAESLAQINAALDRLADETLRDRFVALEPENKWGTLDGARRTMRELRELAEENPARVWRIR